MALTWRQFAFAYEVASKTTAAWSKTIGATGDYATWAAMVADIPDLIAHAVTVTIQAGTTLTETCELKNKHGITKDGDITIQAEKYFPTSGVIPTADSATATTLRDAALATAALGNDYFNGCWIFVVDGTGTDNGFVLIADYIDATGDVVVASWPGTQPDNTSRYLIVGALIDGGSARTYGFDCSTNTVSCTFCGIGIKDVATYGFFGKLCSYLVGYYCGVYNTGYSGYCFVRLSALFLQYCGIAKNNTNSSSTNAGIRIESCLVASLYDTGISDNNKQGIFVRKGGFVESQNSFGDGNGLWGAYCLYSAQVKVVGTECSGSSGNHSDPGTAGTANADQAAVY